MGNIRRFGFFRMNEQVLPENFVRSRRERCGEEEEEGKFRIHNSSDSHGEREYSRETQNL